MRTVADLVGNTPLVVHPYRSNRLHLKIEAGNPGLSIKDRAAFHICRALDATVGLRGKAIVEYSSGNFGIGLAQASKVWGFRLTLIITPDTSPETLQLLRRLGSELIMVDRDAPADAPAGERGLARTIAERTGAIFIDQSDNPLNPAAHYATTGPEIHRAVPHAAYVFSTLGTGGTATGVAQYLRDVGAATRVVGVTKETGRYAAAFRGARAEEGADPIPKNLQFDLLETVVGVPAKASYLEVEVLLEETGLFLGATSGLAIAAAKQLLDVRKHENVDVVVICPDSGNRYVSATRTAASRPASSAAPIVDGLRVGEYPKVVS